MNMDRVNRWLTFVANIGVIAGVFFLVAEIRQSNRIAIATAEIDIRNSFASSNESMYSDPNFADLMVKIRDANAVLTPAEEWRIYQFVLRGLNTWLAIETAYANDMIPRETYDVIENDMRADMSSFPKIVPIYRQAYEDYPVLSDTDVFRKLEIVLKEHEN